MLRSRCPSRPAPREGKPGGSRADCRRGPRAASCRDLSVKIRLASDRTIRTFADQNSVNILSEFIRNFKIWKNWGTFLWISGEIPRNFLNRKFDENYWKVHVVEFFFRKNMYPIRRSITKICWDFQFWRSAKVWHLEDLEKMLKNGPTLQMLFGEWSFGG